jgi:hypothetical protein
MWGSVSDGRKTNHHRQESALLLRRHPDDGGPDHIRTKSIAPLNYSFRRARKHSTFSAGTAAPGPNNKRNSYGTDADASERISRIFLYPTKQIFRHLDVVLLNLKLDIVHPKIRFFFHCFTFNPKIEKYRLFSIY